MRPIGIVGSLSRDLAPGSEPRAGGCPYYAAGALRLLKRPARIVTKCGHEQRRLLLGPLLAQGVPVSWRPGRASTSFEIVCEDDRRSMEVKSIGDRWTVKEMRSWVRKVLEPCEWIHLAPLLRGDFSAAAVAEIARGHLLSFDGQGLARVRGLGPLRLDADFDRELLRHITVLKLAEEEALAVLGEINGASLASLHVPELIVTRGSRGTIVFANRELTEIPARPLVPDAVTTGAGDEFAAIYITARARGRSPLIAARLATAFVGALLNRRLPSA